MNSLPPDKMNVINLLYEAIVVIFMYLYLFTIVLNINMKPMISVDPK